MAKSTGLGWTTLSVDDSSGAVCALVNDVTNCQFSTPRGVQDVTGMDKSAYERLLLLADFSITLNGVFDPGTTPNMAHYCFSTVPSTSVLRTTTLTHLTKTLAVETLYTDYQVTRPAGGELNWQAPGVLGNGAVPTWT